MIIKSTPDIIGSNEQMRKAIIDLWEQTTSQTPWESMSKEEKMRLLQGIAEIASLETIKRYYSEQELFRYVSPELKAFPLVASTYGYKIPDSNLIRINSRYIDDASKSVRVAVHESIHHAQDMVKQHSLPFMKNNIEAQLMFYCMRSPATYGVFGINSNTQLYIQSASSVCDSRISENIRNAFYLVQFVERQANDQSIAVCNDLGIQTDKRIADIDAALDVLKEMYDCTYLSDAEMCKMIDEAQLCVATNTTPSSPRVASIAYDIAVIMADQCVDRDDQLIDHCLSIDTKNNILTQHGITNAQLCSMEDVGILTIDDLASWSQSMRNQNPNIMVGAICQYGEEAARLVDTKTFDQWYFSEDNRFSQSILSRVAEVMGPQYETVERAITTDGTIFEPDDFTFNLLEEQPVYDEVELDELEEQDQETEIDLAELGEEDKAQIDNLMDFIFGPKDPETQDPTDPSDHEWN